MSNEFRVGRIGRYLLACLLICLTANAATLELSIRDESGAPLPCRVLVRDASGNCVTPPAATMLQTGKDLWFMSTGQSTLTVAEGNALVRIERGPEFVRIRETIRVTAPATTRDFTLRRWINMQERGYLCGENHLHVDTMQLAPMLVAEGLDFGTSLTWWRGPDPRRPVPPGEGRVRQLEFAGRTIPTSVYDAELEYAWGAAYIQNLPAPMPITAESGRPNLDYLRHAVDAGAIVHYQGGWSREVLLDALLDCVHTVNVCNNNFALHRFQPRSRYSNLLEVDGFPVYADTDVDMLRMNTDTYYRLLNCGLRLAAGAGTATGVKQAPAGYNRAYVRIDSGAPLDDFYEAWREGRNFVTNGPMLFLSTESSGRPGDEIELPEAGGTVRLHVEALSDQPLTNIELVVNGNVVASFDIDDERRAGGSCEIEFTSGSWIAARCTARDDLLSDDELTAYEDDGRSTLSVAPSRLRFAHTSPIHVTVGGRSVAVPESIAEARRMLDRLEAFIRETADDDYQAAMADALEAARLRLNSAGRLP